MAKRRKPNYYAVRVGRKPGVYNNWEECEKQVSKFPKAIFKGFLERDEAMKFVGDASTYIKGEGADRIRDSVSESNSTSSGYSDTMTTVKVDDAAALMPPPASQSYFDQVSGFVPDNNASFDDEFGRFASSQGLVSGTQEYRRERTRAIRDELKFHYSSQPDDTAGTSQSIPELGQGSLDEQTKLDIYQNMCREIGVDVQDTILKCRRELKNVLVNIIDYIDARRMPGKEIEIWDWENFSGFCEYSLRGDKRIDRNEAKADGGFLSALLHNLTGSEPRRRGPRNRSQRKRNTLAPVAGNEKQTKRKRANTIKPELSKRARVSV